MPQPECMNDEAVTKVILTSFSPKLFKYLIYCHKTSQVGPGGGHSRQGAEAEVRLLKFLCFGNGLQVKSYTANKHCTSVVCAES